MKKNEELGQATQLHKRALEKFKSSPVLPEKLSKLDVEELIEALHVHQIELEMQNDELRVSQNALEESRAKYSDLYDFAPVGYLTLNRKGLILEANLTACSMLGKERSRLLNINNLFINFIIEKGEKNLFYQHLQKVFETHSLGRCELELKGKDNANFYAQLESIVVKGNLNECRTAITDITERKHAQESQAELMKEVERSNRELNQFAYTVSHDLNAPLRNISFLAESIRTDYSEKIGEEGQKQFKLLISRAERMKRLIDGILYYSKIEYVKEKKESVDLNVLVKEIIDLLDSPKQIAIRIESPLPTLVFERVHLHQLFQNLLSNAIQYMDKTEGEITVNGVADGPFWKFSVTDNGPGIEREYYEKIFRLFETLHSEDEGGGTGIGLALVKKIVERAGGKVCVESELGKGSTFFFTLPSG